MFGWLNTIQKDETKDHEIDIELGTRNKISVTEAFNSSIGKKTEPKGFSHQMSKFIALPDITPYSSKVSSYLGYPSSEKKLSDDYIDDPMPTSFFPKILYKIRKSSWELTLYILRFFSFSEFSALQRIVGCIMFLLAGFITLFLCFTSLASLLFGGAVRFVLDYLLASFFFFVASLFVVPLEQQIQTLISPPKRVSSILLLCANILIILATQFSITRTAFIILPIFFVHFGCLINHLLGFFPYGASLFSQITSLVSTSLFFLRKN